jgi:hypothetical protein
VSDGPRFFIRPGMDVYNSRQDRYLGSVVRVVHDTPSIAGGNKAERTASRDVGDSASIVHEEGAVTGHVESRGKRTLGEDLGPVPTARFGNTGPDRQSAGNEYATGIRDLPPDISHIMVRPGRMNFGPFTPTFTVSSSEILSSSMERIVLDWE